MGVITRLESNRGYAINEISSTVLNATSTTETALFSDTIPAGKLGTFKLLNFSFIAHLSTPALSLPSLTLKLKFGSTAATTIVNSLLAASISDKPILISGTIANLGVTNSQYIFINVTNYSNTAIFGALGSSFVVSDGTWVVDTTVDQVLSITGQFTTGLSTTSITPKLIQINVS